MDEMELKVLLRSSSVEEGRRRGKEGNGEEKKRGSSGNLLIDNGMENS